MPTTVVYGGRERTLMLNGVELNPDIFSKAPVIDPGGGDGTVTPGTRRGKWVGMGERKNFTGQAAIIARTKCFVHEIDWVDAQPDPFGPISPATISGINTAVARAEQYDMVIKIRLFTGIRSPSWALSLGAGPILNWYEPVDLQAYVDIPLYYDDAFIDGYEDLVTKIGPYFTSPRIVQCTVAGATTVYSEPTVKQLSNAENRATLMLPQYGYSSERDQEALRRCMRIHHAVMSPLGVTSSVAYNSWQEVVPSTGKINTDSQKAIALMNYQTQLMGREFSVWQNNSAMAKFTTGTSGPVTNLRTTYNTIYAHMKDRALNHGQQLEYQTATLPKITADTGGGAAGVRATAQWCIEQGAHGIEMPAGWSSDTYMTTAQAATLNAALAANAA